MNIKQNKKIAHGSIQMIGLDDRILVITKFLSQQEKNNRELGVLCGEGKLGYGEREASRVSS